jgi:hypothetical protein
MNLFETQRLQPHRKSSKKKAALQASESRPGYRFWVAQRFRAAIKALY